MAQVKYTVRIIQRLGTRRRHPRVRLGLTLKKYIYRTRTVKFLLPLRGLNLFENLQGQTLIETFLRLP